MYLFVNILSTPNLRSCSAQCGEELDLFGEPSLRFWIECGSSVEIYPQIILFMGFAFVLETLMILDWYVIIFSRQKKYSYCTISNETQAFNIVMETIPWRKSIFLEIFIILLFWWHSYILNTPAGSSTHGLNKDAFS